MGDPVAVVGTIAAAVIAAAGLLLRDRRLSSVCLSLALVLAAVVLLGDSWHDSRVVELRDHPGEILAAIAAGIVVCVLLAVLMRRRAQAFPLLAAAALPFRIPIDIGGGSANLLIPLYVVLAAALLAAIWDAFSSRDPGGGADAEPVLPGGLPGWSARWLPAVLAAAVVLYAVGTSYSSDFSMGLHDACFFLIPFAVLFALLLGCAGRRSLLRLVFAVVIA